MHIRCQNGAGTKMHKCLVWFSLKTFLDGGSKINLCKKIQNVKKSHKSGEIHDCALF